MALTSTMPTAASGVDLTAPSANEDSMGDEPPLDPTLGSGKASPR
jgi:hypothetical protein